MKRLSDPEIKNIQTYSFHINDIDIPKLTIDYELLVRQLESEIKWLKDDVRQCKEEYSWISP